MSSTPFNPAGLNTGLSTDLRSLDALKSAAARDPKASIKETAKQFESLFMQEVMKSMRASTLSTGMLDNSASQMGTEMLDQQFAGKMTGLPGGLSEAIQKQLARSMGVADDKVTKQPVQPLPTLSKRGVQPHVQSFIQSQEGAARAAEQATGIPASFMLAQAAHETGWASTASRPRTARPRTTSSPSRPRRAGPARPSMCRPRSTWTARRRR